MNRHRVLLDMRSNSVVFPKAKETSREERIAEISPLSISEPPKPFPKILQRPRPSLEEEAFTIHSVNADVFGFLARQAKTKGTQLFAISMEDIDNLLRANQKDALEVHTIETSVSEKETIQKKLPPEYQDFRDVFNRTQADKLPPHRSYDYKIELTSDTRPP